VPHHDRRVRDRVQGPCPTLDPTLDPKIRRTLTLDPKPYMPHHDRRVRDRVQGPCSANALTRLPTLVTGSTGLLLDIRRPVKTLQLWYQASPVTTPQIAGW